MSTTKRTGKAKRETIAAVQKILNATYKTAVHHRERCEQNWCSNSKSELKAFIKSYQRFVERRYAADCSRMRSWEHHRRSLERLATIHYCNHVFNHLFDSVTEWLREFRDYNPEPFAQRESVVDDLVNEPFHIFTPPPEGLSVASQRVPRSARRTFFRLKRCGVDMLDSLDELDSIFNRLKSQVYPAPKAAESKLYEQYFSKGDKDTAKPILSEWDADDCVEWQGVFFRFTEQQTLAVKYLIKKKREGKASIRNIEIIKHLAGKTKNLRDVFRANRKNHPAFGKLIIQPRNGHFSINIEI